MKNVGWESTAHRSDIAGQIMPEQWRASRTLANGAGLIVEFDFHFGAGGSGLPKNDRYPGLDRDHAPAFWRSVARAFAKNHSVIFNLINEPYIKSWPCYLNGGCETPPVGKLGRWRVVGTQSVVNAIRATGAANPDHRRGVEFLKRSFSLAAVRPGRSRPRNRRGRAHVLRRSRLRRSSLLDKRVRRHTGRRVSGRHRRVRRDRMRAREDRPADGLGGRSATADRVLGMVVESF